KSDQLPPPENIIEHLGLPVVIKPACEGSSLGVTIARTVQELILGLEAVKPCGQWIIAEEYIAGREITVSVLGNDYPQALSLIEIIPGDGYEFFDFEAKYKPGASREICPAPLPRDLEQTARELGVRAHQVLYCRGLSRTDLRLRDGQYFVLENYREQLQAGLEKARAAGLTVETIDLEVAPITKTKAANYLLVANQPELPQLHAHATPPLHFNSRFTFERFVVGANNHYAFAATQ
ncbi:MAG: hypothetical protein HQK55_13595, partial [Deltaproteobacteria bacterium]|nr:hypothetical protein [Deltaproteobacteria bacterium]